MQCDPYFDQKGCAHPGCYPTYETPKCEKQCVDDEFWVQSKHLGVNAYEMSMEPEDLMAELYTNGPVEVAFEVYEVAIFLNLSSRLSCVKKEIPDHLFPTSKTMKKCFWFF